MFFFSVGTERRKSLGQIDGRFVEDSYTKGFVKKTRKKAFLKRGGKKRERYFFIEKKCAPKRESVCACVCARKRENELKSE